MNQFVCLFLKSTFLFFPSFFIQRRPFIGIHPMGTGNDLARVLGWGVKYVGDEHEIEELLYDFENADRVPFDR